MTLHQFSLPSNFNGEQFIEESNAKDVFVRENVLFIESDKTKKELEALLQAHDPKTVEPTINEKLASVGLSINDLKLALGL